jgi:hypothetical protein
MQGVLHPLQGCHSGSGTASKPAGSSTAWITAAAATRLKSVTDMTFWHDVCMLVGPLQCGLTNHQQNSNMRVDVLGALKASAHAMSTSSAIFHEPVSAYKMVCTLNIHAGNSKITSNIQAAPSCPHQFMTRMRLLMYTCVNRQRTSAIDFTTAQQQHQLQLQQWVATSAPPGCLPGHPR